MTQNGVLSQNQQRALVALLTYSTVREAARAAGVSERQIWRYLADENFKTKLRRLQDQAITAAVAALSGLAGDAIETLRVTLEDSTASASARVRAAVAVLQERRRLGELEDLVQRVQKLEALNEYRTQS